MDSLPYHSCSELRNETLETPPLPQQPSGTTSELFIRIKRTIAGQTYLPESVCALLTFWVFSTFFQETHTFLPCLVITGPAHEGTVVLRALNTVCYAPKLLAGLNSAIIKDIGGHYGPTLLIFDPNLDKRTAAFLDCFTNRGFIMSVERSYRSFFSSKAIYAGDAPPMKSMPQQSIHINATVASNAAPQHASQLSREYTDGLRKQLQQYSERNRSS